MRIFGDTTAIGVNAYPSTRPISGSEDENENDVASNTNFGVEENDKGKNKKRVRRIRKDKFDSFFSTFINNVYVENSNRKMLSLRKDHLVLHLVKLMRAKHQAKKMISIMS